MSPSRSGGPWLGLALSLVALVVAGLVMLWLALAVLRGGPVPATLTWLLLGSVSMVYAGLWLLLRAEVPPEAMRRLSMGLLLLVLCTYGIGVPAWALLTGLWVLGLLLVAKSGPVLFIAWVEHCDRTRRDRPPPE